MIEFGDNLNWKWVGELDVAEFTVNVDGSPVICRVSRECLMLCGLFSVGDHADNISMTCSQCCYGAGVKGGALGPRH